MSKKQEGGSKFSIEFKIGGVNSGGFYLKFCFLHASTTFFIKKATFKGPMPPGVGV